MQIDELLASQSQQQQRTVVSAQVGEPSQVGGKYMVSVIQVFSSRLKWHSPYYSTVKYG